jgi:hypothetical protein
MSAVLDTILARAETLARADQTPVAVFDLDSTLYSTQERNWAILQEFASRSTAHPRLREHMGKLTAAEMGWNAMDDLRRVGFGHEPTLAELRHFWFHRFFRDEYLAHDVPLPGALDFVRDLHAAGATVYYLSGRDEPNMGRGTRKSLAAHGFPLDQGRAHVRLKPRFEEDDLVFKRRVVVELARAGEVITAAENEPENANMFFAAFPQAHVLFLETVCSPNPPALAEGIHRLRDFRYSREGSSSPSCGGPSKSA